MSSFATISRDFKGIWISREIWLDDRLGFFEKCLLAELDSLSGSDGCFASNEYLANFFQMKERKIQEGLSLLKSLGYVTQESFDGRTRILRTNVQKNRNVEFNTSATSNSDVADMSKSAPLTCPNPHLSHNIYSKEENKEEIPPPRAASLLAEFFSSLSTSIPNFSQDKMRHTQKQLNAMDALISIHGEEKIRSVFLYAHQSEFWRAYVHTAVYLKQKFETLRVQMQSKKENSNETLKKPYLNTTEPSAEPKFRGRPISDFIGN